MLTIVESRSSNVVSKHALNLVMLIESMNTISITVRAFGEALNPELDPKLTG